MASSSVEATELSSSEENNNVTATTGNLLMQSSSSVDADDVQESKDKLSSSSSESSPSPNSPLGDPFREDKDTLQTQDQGSTSLPKYDSDAQIENGNSQKPVADTSLARDEAPTGELPVSLASTADVGHEGASNSDSILVTESPPVQVMERSTSKSYRIPSHVFTRSKSNTPEWSVASNDSLFSIHMGNMSFTKDQFLWRLDDLGPLDESSPSEHLKFNSEDLPSGNKVVDGKSKELGIGRGKVGVTEGVSRLNTTEDQVQEKPVAEDHISHHSAENSSIAVCRKSNEAHAMKNDVSLRGSPFDIQERHISSSLISRMSEESDNSTKSFAFPILEGADKGILLSITNSPKLRADPLRTHSQTVKTLKKSELNSPAATQPQTGTSWFSWFSCSTCCRSKSF